jgi:2-C-methyl-D-erythritol 2,4-cyclodiphosphate synthase
MKFKTGIGIDVHPLVENRELWLGGILVAHDKGCAAHSDGDVLVHAICDALLGAAGLEDIGSYFPDTDPAYKGIDSKVLLQRVARMVREEGFAIGNIDCVVCLERPRIKTLVPDMRQCLAGILDVEVADLTIKATTTERLGFEGREEGISAYASALIYKL